MGFESLRGNVRTEESQIAKRSQELKAEKVSEKKVWTQENSNVHAQQQAIQVDSSIAKELKELARRMEALDKKINSRTTWYPKPYFDKNKGKDKGQGQENDQNKKDESKNKTEKAKEENSQNKQPLN